MVRLLGYCIFRLSEVWFQIFGYKKRNVSSSQSYLFWLNTSIAAVFSALGLLQQFQQTDREVLMPKLISYLLMFDQARDYSLQLNIILCSYSELTICCVNKIYIFSKTFGSILYSIFMIKGFH
ncbi:hypothetical protein MANES_11G156150v8 [Manihot esculenta]|uniref:Uncharacterized protein n=1 Tax=Manihot esculenta TaxID=3983 RepID=A0ACB7GY87_MANES|nr:hypothetical protein MANES_11G156150v8 [Manihot esculenta]